MGRETVVVFNASKTRFLNLLPRRNYSNNEPLLRKDTLLSLSLPNIIGLSFNYNINWKIDISSVAKSESINIGLLIRLHFILYLLLLQQCTETTLVWSIFNMFHMASTYTLLLDRMESIFLVILTLLL